MFLPRVVELRVKNWLRLSQAARVEWLSDWPHFLVYVPTLAVPPLGAFFPSAFRFQRQKL